MENFSFSELYDVVLKATYPMKIEKRTFEEGEVVCEFDKIQIADFGELKKVARAQDTRTLLVWDNTQEVQIVFTQGVFSKEQFAVLNNARVLNEENLTDEEMMLAQREKIETDEDGAFSLKRQPEASQPIFITRKDTGEICNTIKKIGENKYVLEPATPFTDLIIDYSFKYQARQSHMHFGLQITECFFTLEGRTRFKDDKDGKLKTGIIKIPRLRIITPFHISVGKDATPNVAAFNGIACPALGNKRNSYTMKMILLDEDIDTDID